jgi:hypothetical protein
MSVMQRTTQPEPLLAAIREARIQWGLLQAISHQLQCHEREHRCGAQSQAQPENSPIISANP